MAAPLLPSAFVAVPCPGRDQAAMAFFGIWRGFKFQCRLISLPLLLSVMTFDHSRYVQQERQCGFDLILVNHSCVAPFDPERNTTCRDSASAISGYFIQSQFRRKAA